MAYIVRHGDGCGCSNIARVQRCETPYAVALYLWGRDVGRHWVMDTTRRVTYRFSTGDIDVIRRVLEGDTGSTIVVCGVESLPTQAPSAPAHILDDRES